MATKRSPPTFLSQWVNQGRGLLKTWVNKLSPEEPAPTQTMLTEENEEDHSSKNTHNQKLVTPAFDLAKEKQNKAFQEFIKSILAISVSVDKNKISKKPPKSTK